MPKKAQLGEIPQKHLCVENHTLNSLLPLVVKAHSKAQDDLPWYLYQKLMSYTQC